MNRIDEAFLAIKNESRKGFIPFVTACDPDQSVSEQVVLKLAELGADVVELGVPFSDPMADGPVIQMSYDRALKNGASLKMTLELVGKVRSTSQVPIVLFSYYNPLFRYGLKQFARDAAAAGADGVLVTDVIGDEANQTGVVLKEHGMHLISLIAPTTSEERLRTICENASGFIYAISRRGITGGSVGDTSEAELLVHRARPHTKLPIAVGFGISDHQQLAKVCEYADAAVVGSAIVAEITEDSADPVSAVERKVRSLLRNK